MHSEAAAIYLEACNREHAECALELVQAFDNNEREVSLSQRAVPLNDVDVSCIAEALCSNSHSLRVLSMEGNAFGLPGLQTLLEAIEENPGIIRELRLGKNKLKDQAAVVIGHMLARGGCGLKVLDLSENAISKIGVIPIAAALTNESCDIVELSFHNNKIEGDAAAYLGKAILQAGKLKHLHLGYNTIRDTGATQLAQCIPITLGLSTLDLTANRIGPAGGKELARALMSSTCNIQRLNLRHNLFDSETIEVFSAVIAKNTSLIQLFLGFMNPAPEASASVLAALCRNRTLLLLDIYGWKLPPDGTWSLIDRIQKENSTLAAIVTDACHSIARRIDDGNEERTTQGRHPIYVGPDDRDAYMATKSLSRFSRAQSRRQSRASSRTGSPQDASRRRVETPNRRSVDSHARSSSRGHSNRPVGSDNLPKQQPQPQPQPQPQMRSGSQTRSQTGNHTQGRAPSQTQTRAQSQHQTEKQIETQMDTRSAAGPQAMPRAPQPQPQPQRRISPLRSASEQPPRRRSPTVPRTEDKPVAPSGDSIYTLVAQLKRTVAELQDGHKALSARVAALESRPKCNCGAVRQVSSNPAPPQDTKEKPDGSRSPERGVYSHTGDTYSEAQRPNGAWRSTSTGSAAELQRPSEQRSDMTEPPAEPLELPRERRPQGVALQTSTRPMENYHPHIDPSPLRDANPPMRKGSFIR